MKLLEELTGSGSKCGGSMVDISGQNTASGVWMGDCHYREVRGRGEAVGPLCVHAQVFSKCLKKDPDTYSCSPGMLLDPLSFFSGKVYLVH